MKKLLYIISGFAIIGFASCSKQVDNYDAPGVTLQGSFISKISKKPVQTEIGYDNYSGSNGYGSRIKLRELSWSSNPTAQYVTGKQDGTYFNSKLFAATYEMTPQGGFVPYTPDTVVVKDGVITKDFTVEPFYEVEWVNAPVVKADGTIEVIATISRGTDNVTYQKPMNDMWLFVNTSPYIGEKSFDSRFSRSMPLAGLQYDKPLVFTTAVGQKIPSGTWYIRVGARMAHNDAVMGVHIFNYSTPVKVTIP